MMQMPSQSDTTQKYTPLDGSKYLGECGQIKKPPQILRGPVWLIELLFFLDWAFIRVWGNCLVHDRY